MTPPRHWLVDSHRLIIVATSQLTANGLLVWTRVYSQYLSIYLSWTGYAYLLITWQDSARAWGLWISSPVVRVDCTLPFLYHSWNPLARNTIGTLGFILCVASCGIDLKLEIRNKPTALPFVVGWPVRGWERLWTRKTPEPFNNIMGNIFCFHFGNGC